MNEKREMMWKKYNEAKLYFIEHPSMLINIEKFIMDIIKNTVVRHLPEIQRDYNEASYLYPFWGAYPPLERGKASRGDQVPWIEVGEFAVGDKLKRLIESNYSVREVGLPSGTDTRYLIQTKSISDITLGFLDSAFIFLDIKSVGPRDNFENAAASPYQVSGNGVWEAWKELLKNSPILSVGPRAQHLFYPALAPVYVLSDGTIAPSIHLFVRPIYKMLRLEDATKNGQPLSSIEVVCFPNGLLLTMNPGYLSQYPGILYPGKDKLDVNPLKIRARISFKLVRSIAEWRYFRVEVPEE